jgi:hypothetical protein
VKFANTTGLEKPAALSLAETFKPIFAKARAAIADAQGVAESVKDATCVKEIKKSRSCRLALRAVRLESENTRKVQKQHALLYGKAVDGFHNILLADLSPVETALQEAEDVAERAEAARLAQLKADREKELQPLLDAPILGDLSALSEKEYAQTLSDAKLLKQAKIDAAAKAEAEAKAKAEAERLERERIAAENARLAAEAARLKAEAEAREAAARKEREEAARALAAERQAAEAAAKAAAELARREREAVEAKARAERQAAEAAAKQEQARLKAIADEERRKLAQAEAAAKALRDAEAKRQSEAAAARKSAAALFGGSKPDSRPDNAKAQAFADSLRAMPLPKFTGKAFDGLPARIENLAQWIESQIGEGELL